MTSLDLVAIGAPIAALFFMGLVALVETRLMARAKRREQFPLFVTDFSDLSSACFD